MPHLRRVREEVFCKFKDGFDLIPLRRGFVLLKLGEEALRSDLVELAVKRLGIDCLLEEERRFERELGDRFYEEVSGLLRAACAHPHRLIYRSAARSPLTSPTPCFTR